MNYALIRKTLKQYIDQGAKNFVIFPYGEMGMLVKQILNQGFGIAEKLIVDNELCKYNESIKDSNALALFLEQHKGENDYVIFASRNAVLLERLKNLCPEESIIRFTTDVGKQGKYCTGPLVEDPIYENRLICGNFCNFALGTTAVWNHQLGMVTNHGFVFSAAYCGTDIQEFDISDFNKKFEIGNDVWLGQNVILTNGVKIGNGVRAAAGAVITKDVPDFAIVAGIPARIIGYRFTAEQIAQLNEIAWWDWPIEKIMSHYSDFFDINIFLQKHYPPVKHS